jgi:hydrogenase maturation protein HypF
LITAEIKTLDIKIRGRIQGVGFRPFIYRLASEYNLYGWVNNQTSHVKIHVEGKKTNVDSFVRDITEKAPSISVIDHLATSISEFKAFEDFSIIPSVDSSDTVTEVSPDLAVCDECMEDIDFTGRRKDYSFTNCTNCGPRLSIVESLPYDRPYTTMKSFRMCPECMEEYESPANRRFHAQPNSCSLCGPYYTMTIKSKTITDIKEILKECSRIIQNGGTLAIKGIGGFHFACNPFDSKAVLKLREIKKRDGKPFAVMFSSIEDLKNYTEFSVIEEESLRSVQAPIVLLKKIRNISLSSEVSKGLNTLGCFLPYTPFHYLLMKELKIPAIVLTSGNISREPIEIDNNQALERFNKLCDGVLTFNRDISNRTDDSVVKVINGKVRLFRRSRGWAPESIPANIETEGIFAAGSELKTCFAIGKSDKAILSQHIGDLQNYETFDFYSNTIEKYKALFRFSPSIIAHDLHPDYMSTKYSENITAEKMPIQHHHAHIASCMIENNISKEIIGFSFDGTGLGDDGHIWGGEVFICDLLDYNREFHFKYLPLPGGDKAVEEPWRMGISALYTAVGRTFLNMDLPFLKQIPLGKVEKLLDVIDKKINSPLTSSIGRVFDAVSAILGLCLYCNFDAEAPMRLESILDDSSKNESFYLFKIEKEIDLNSVFENIAKDIVKGIPVSTISRLFHNTIVEIICECAERLRFNTHINTVALSGGVFMNAYLLENAERRLSHAGFTVLSNSKVPLNDGGIALGQLGIAAHRREQRRTKECV